MNSLLHWNGPQVKKLLGWRCTEEEEKWSEKAVESLVKKIKKRNHDGCGTIEDLEYALANPGSLSKCVTIPKSLDGRLQVSHKKGLPHVIYCRVWRWPDLQNHQELRPVPECLYPHDHSNKSQHICINPYHYQRIEHPRMHSFSSYPSSSFSSPEPIPSPMSSSEYILPPLSIQSTATTCSPPPNSISSVSSGSPEYGIGSPSVFSEDGDASSRIPSPLVELMPNVHYWCSVSYYELNSRIGEQFKISHPVVTIDGFTDPCTSDNRICLGLLSNVNRNTVVENTRKHIGRGIRLEYLENEFHLKDLTLINLSESPIFVQSRNCNITMNYDVSAVCRLPPGGRLVIFKQSTFANMLHRARAATRTEVYELQKMCIVRISFAKGWGPDYPRQDVTSTPCWMELQLHLPMAWIDSTMNQMPIDDEGPNSYT